MKNFENSSKEEMIKERIFDRKEIIAPPNFVSIFHETKDNFLSKIDQHGLKRGIEKNIGDASEMIELNMSFDKFRPEELKEKGLSRSHNMYGYPYLEQGSGFSEPNSKVLELKVDPQKCFVGEMGKIASISSLTLAGKISEERATEIIAEEYWNELITLEDFLRWYRKPEVGTDGFVKDEDQYRGGEASAIGFCVLEHAPKQLPWSFNFPEILIPGDIQQEYIKLVK